MGYGMEKTIAIIIVLAPLVSGTALKLTWQDCGGSDPVHVTGVTPTEIQLGQTTTITGSGTTDVAITGGTYTVKMVAAGITLLTHSGDFCKPDTINLPLGTGSITWKGESCPVSKGPNALSMDVTLSSELPSSLTTATITLSATATNGDALVCVTLNTSPAEEFSMTDQAVFQTIAAMVNAAATTWTAGVTSRFQTLDDVKTLCGTILKGETNYTEFLEEKTEQEVPNAQIPSDFDVRTAWPKCASVSGHIRDQSACGSCWAFGSTEAFNDRQCIATGDTTLLSAEDTTANCGLLQCFSMGCGGGQPGAAWSWFQKQGVVTGGDYDDVGKGDTCGPYTLKPCAHHVPATSKYPACPSNEYSTPTLKACQQSYSKSYAADKIKASGSYSLSGVSKIQSDIMKYGSVTAAFTVYSDFPTYKSGVYKHTTGSALGGHAVKILGWGVESGQDYWLVANSWNEQWGDQGLFKIARGIGECGIESQISAGTAASSTLVV